MTEEKSSGDVTTATTDNVKKPRRVIRRRNRNKKEEIQIDPVLLEKTMKESNLPAAYSFEIVKTVQRILQLKAKHIALQMPEGLLLYATVLSDVLKRLVAATGDKSTTPDSDNATTPAHRPLQVSILGDVTYGACCVDDLGAQALGCDLLVHYGHSCLVPINHTAIPCLYVFVEITIDTHHLVECVDMTLQQQQKPSKIYLLGTIQFRHALSEAKKLLQEKDLEVEIPQAKPLSPGEVLGCTSPVLCDNDSSHNAIVVFVADGRFHLESTLISNPHIQLFLRYDPYSKALTEESYGHEQMKKIRHEAIVKAQLTTGQPKIFGIILGTLGRQGNPALLSSIQTLLKQHQQKSFVMLASEITPAKLSLFQDKVDVWVQIACPRLSVDWGHFLSQKPVLNPYELYCALGEAEFDTTSKQYPMDYYSSEGGPWSNYHGDNKERILSVGEANA